MATATLPGRLPPWGTAAFACKERPAREMAERCSSCLDAIARRAVVRLVGARLVSSEGTVGCSSSLAPETSAFGGGAAASTRAVRMQISAQRGLDREIAGGYGRLDGRRHDPGRSSMLRRCRWSLAGAMAVAIALVVPAQATPPVKDEQTFTGTAPWTMCDGVQIFVEFVDVHMDTFFYDKAGNIVRYVSHSKGQGTLVNPETGVTNTGAGPSKVTVDLRSETVSIVGQIFHNTEPGAGRVALSAGKLTFELISFDPEERTFVAGDLLHVGGPHPNFEDIDWCSLVD